MVFAQSEDDALRYSFMQPGGTARSVGIGGAFGAVGADPSSISLNPAGLGLYTTSEMSITPTLEVNDARSTHYGSSSTGTADRFFINNLAVILSAPTKPGNNWRYTTFGLVYDRVASHYWSRVASAEGVKTSLLETFAAEAAGTAAGDLYNAFPFSAGLAWDAYAIDPLDTVALTYTPAIPFASPVTQQHEITSQGATKTTSFFFAANYDDRFFVGASLGIVGLRYDRVTEHRETTEDLALPFRSFSYREDLTTRGNGIDLKIGGIAKATEQLRLGLSFHSPLWVNMNDAYRTTLRTSFRNGDSYEISSPDGSYAYRLRTPWKLVGSASYIFGKSGLVSVDVEWNDHRTAKLNRSLDIVDSYDFAQENRAIRALGANTVNLRAGTEWRTGNIYYRAGAGYYPSAYADGDPRSGDALIRFGGGLGYRSERISVDVALDTGKRTGGYFQYDPSLVQATTEQLTATRGMLTFAYRP